MIDDTAGVDVGQRLAGQAAAFLLLVDPGGQRLLDDPPSRALQARGNLVDLFCVFRTKVTDVSGRT